MKQKLLLALFALLTGINASAYDAVIDGIYYEFSGDEATVTGGISEITSVVIPETVTVVGNTYLVTSIGKQAFRMRSSLTSVTIGSGVKSIGSQAFFNCRGLTKVIVPDIAAWCGISFGNDSANPLYNVNAHHLFSDEDTEITDLIIPVGVTSIGNYAFTGCSNLTSVTIPESVTSIGDRAFSSCSSLTSVTIPGSVTSIGEEAFYNCSGLTSVTIPEGVTSIGDQTFLGCSSLTSITIPESVTSIGGSAFINCSGLTSVTLESNAIVSGTTYGESLIDTFGKQVTEFILGDAVTAIGDHAFHGYRMSENENLISVNIPEGVVSIGYGAFAGCSGLTSIVIPSSVTSIGGGAFQSCSGLTSIIIPDGVTSMGGDGAGVFWNCTGLVSVTIGHGVTSIGPNDFSDCTSLSQVIIPESVTSIGWYAFGGCSSLTEVYCYAENVPSTDGYAFDAKLIATATLHVPESSIDAYRETEPWSWFGSIVALAENTGDLNGDFKVDIADAVSILNLMAEGADNPSADLNGDGKVDIADFVSVLNLMAGQ